MLPISKNISNRKKGYPGWGRRVFVGLSGGVDSAVSAALLKEQGYDVTGVFIKVWQPDFLPCTWRSERRDAMRVALALGIPFLHLDFETEYKKGVVDNMLEEYKKGRTPNPDILCNREIKFGAFWREAQKRGADFIATGHYANISRKSTEVFSAENLPDSRPVALRDTFSGQYLLHEGKDQTKDQSYFLWTLTREDLAHTLFPIGHLEKSEVRRLAKKFKIPVSEKKDSQGICFIGEVSMDEFLSHYIDTKPGKVLDIEGKVVGRHKGAVLYTIGERRGFVVEKKGADSGAYYIVSKDINKNTITVSNKEREIASSSPKKIFITNENWLEKPSGPRIHGRIRYRGAKESLRITRGNNGSIVEFDSPQKGLSLGQSIVFYEGEKVLGGAIMDKILE